MEYSNYNNIFLVEYIVELQKNTGINEHAIKFKKNKQPSFEPIYNLELVELKTLKTYIKTNLANNFIQPFKSPIKTSILFNRKLDKNLHFYVDY